MSRLEQRIRRLEDDKGNRRRAVIVIEVDETEEAARARHFAEHPEDRDARNILYVKLEDPTRNVPTPTYDAQEETI
jgi:hypothetical protein